MISLSVANRSNYAVALDFSSSVSASVSIRQTTVLVKPYSQDGIVINNQHKIDADLAQFPKVSS